MQWCHFLLSSLMWHFSIMGCHLGKSCLQVLWWAGRSKTGFDCTEKERKELFIFSFLQLNHIATVLKGMAQTQTPSKSPDWLEVIFWPVTAAEMFSSCSSCSIKSKLIWLAHILCVLTKVSLTVRTSWLRNSQASLAILGKYESL